MDETVRIKEAYARRDSLDKSRLYSRLNPSALFIYQERERAVIDALSANGFDDLSDSRILDVGCGTGETLRDFIKYGASPGNLSGIDLLHDRIERARALSPGIGFRAGNAEELPYPDRSFDIVLCFTVFSSVLDGTMKRKIASEMTRVLSESGIILWYDFHVNNPRNPDVRGIKKSEVLSLFPGCGVSLKRIVLAPPLLRVIAPRSLLLCHMLQGLKILNTHHLGVIKKKD
jgi:ubiquinone/menaquinone biosynthesis C-methylase UbiE